MTTTYANRREQLDAEIARLRAEREDLTAIPTHVVDRIAADTGYTTRHVRRRIADARDGVLPQRGWQPDDSALAAVFATSGIVTNAWRLLAREGVRVPSRRTFSRAILRELGQVGLQHAKRGILGVRETQIYLRVEDRPRNNTWELDHAELPVLVVPTGHKTPVKPWITAAIDHGTRMLMGWAITFGRPTEASVRAALTMGVTGRYAPTGDFIGGAPHFVVWDRGLEFLADSVTDMCLSLRIASIPAPPYSPELKGRIERWNRTVQEELCARLPGYTDGPRDIRGRGYLQNEAISQDVFLARLENWIEEYCFERHHQGIDGRTPLEAWLADATPIERRQDHELRAWMMPARDNPYKVTKNGIRFRKRDYVAHELGSVKGLHVELRYLPNEPAFVEVFHQGRWICRAWDSATLASDRRADFLEGRKAEKRRLAELSRQSRALRHRVVERHGAVIRLDRETDGISDLLTGGDDALEQIRRGARPELQQEALL